jgi:hypothetical protein
MIKSKKLRDRALGHVPAHPCTQVDPGIFDEHMRKHQYYTEQFVWTYRDVGYTAIVSYGLSQFAIGKRIMSICADKYFLYDTELSEAMAKEKIYN